MWVTFRQTDILLNLWHSASFCWCNILSSPHFADTVPFPKNSMLHTFTDNRIGTHSLITRLAHTDWWQDWHTFTDDKIGTHSLKTGLAHIHWWQDWHTFTDDKTITAIEDTCARHFSNRCDVYKLANVVHRNQSDNHCNWSDTWPSPMLLPELY